MSKIKELRKAFDASTQREWEVLKTCGQPHVACLTENGVDVMTVAACGTDADAKFIALAHNQTPRLLRMEKLLTKLEVHLDWIGWGDRYERECSAELRKELEEFRKEELK